MKYNLSEVNELIRNRRTIKPELFSGRKVHKEVIKTLLDNARWAPNHALTQPWEFHVFTENGIDKLSEFQSKTYKEITPSDQFNQTKFELLKSRPLLASAICMKRQEAEKIPEIEEIAAVACAVQNMQLTATAFGIGTYWGSGGLTYTPEMKAFLGLSEKDKCLGFLYLGYPSTEWPKSHRKPIEYFTKWVD